MDCVIGAVHQESSHADLVKHQICLNRLWAFPVHELGGIVSCDSAAIRIMRCQRPAKRQKHKPCETKALLPLLLSVGSSESVLKVPKRGQFHDAIRVTTKRCDSCAQGAPGRRPVSRRNSSAMRNR